MTAWNRRTLVWAVSAVWLVTACVTAPTTPPDAAARAAAFSIRDLAGGRLSSPPSGKAYIRVIEFAQPPGHSFPSKTHAPGFDYVASGVQRLTIGDRPPLDIAAGESVFQTSLAHVHSNPGSSPNHWYFVALWPIVSRTEALVDPSVAKVAYESADIPEDALPLGSYVQTLRLADIEPGGRTAAHRYGGLEAAFVLEGSITVNARSQRPVRLTAGEGIFHFAGTDVQEHNAGAGRARFLEMLTTAEGQPFETTLDRAP